MNQSQIIAEVRTIIADILDVPASQIERTTTADQVPGWDSFNHINIVVAVEDKFGIKIHTAEVEELRNVGGLVDLVAKKLSP